VQSSPRATRKASLRREVNSKPRPRLTRPRVLQSTESTAPRGYGELPDSAKEALERSSADFTAGRLAERAQHARRAAARAVGLPPSGGQPSAAGPAPSGGQAPADGTGLAAGPAPAELAGQPEPWFANVAEAAGPAGEQAGTPAGDGQAPGTGPVAGDSVPVPGDGAPASHQVAAARPVAHWAWLSIAAMAVPLAALLLAVLV
jgi:hypothetical protein